MSTHTQSHAAYEGRIFPPVPPSKMTNRYNLRNASAPGAAPTNVTVEPPSTFVEELGGLAGNARYSDVLLVRSGY